MTRSHLLLVLACAACGGSDNGDVVGPFTGTVHRFAVDTITLPHSSDEVKALADDLNGDGMLDNQVGNVTSSLFTLGDATTHEADMVAAGAVASSIEIQADSLDTDPGAGVRFVGADGEDATEVGGAITAGAFTSNRTRTTHVPGTAIVHLPVFNDADPLVLALTGMEVDLTPDGAGGYDAIVRGGVKLEDARAAGYIAINQLIDSNPKNHLLFANGMDLDHDGQITRDEFDQNTLITSFLAADIQLYDGTSFAPKSDITMDHPDSLSAGFGVHLVPCDAGRCSAAVQPADACSDRVRDGDETDIDCGGATCPNRCPAAAACSEPGDCQSHACDGGHCRAASCTDGLQDRFETDVDCGGNCGGCALGKACFAGRDCESGMCTSMLGAIGMCVAP